MFFEEICRGETVESANNIAQAAVVGDKGAINSIEIKGNKQLKLF